MCIIILMIRRVNLENSTVHIMTKREIPEAAKTLSQAFVNDPLMLWLFGTQDAYNKNSQVLFSTWINYCIRYGKAFRTESFESVALRKVPGDTKLSLWRMLRSGLLKTGKLLGKEGMKRLILMDKILSEEQKKNMNGRPYWYCEMLGTRSDKQKQGYAKLLMNKTFALAKEDNVPCYLEAITQSAMQCHLHAGYKKLSERNIPDSDITIYSMLRENN
jgi:hypothetical protein